MFKEFNPRGHVRTTQANLPHWSQVGALYFVTFRLMDSLPQEKLAILRHEPGIDDRVHAWLDAGTGSCLLAKERPHRIVQGALRFFDEDRYALDDSVVAANHVHVLLSPIGAWTLSEIINSWKGYTVHRIARGPIWQKESYDHLVRSRAELERIRAYIRRHQAWEPRAPS